MVVFRIDAACTAGLAEEGHKHPLLKAVNMYTTCTACMQIPNLNPQGPKTA